MDFDSLVDDSQKAVTASKGAPVSFDALQDDSEKYGNTAGIAKAFGLGAARSASFGLSDELLTSLGAMTPEDLKAYREQNPVATGAGEIAGVAGALLAPEAGILGAASAPVKGVARLGGAVTEGVAGLLPEATGTIGKILSQGAAHGLGSAVEGAAYGLGQSVSEHALGDPDLTAEKVLANMGTGAIVGGALGSVFGGVKGAFGKAPKFISEVDQKGIEAGDWQSMANAADFTEAERKGFVDGLRKKKANAGEIEAAAKELNAPLLPGMVSDSKLVQQGQDALLNSPLSLPGIRANKIATQGIERAEMAAQDALGAEGDMTKASLGDSLKSMVAESVERQAAPINELYSELKNTYEAIPTSEKALKQIAANIRKIEDVPLSPQARSIAESAAERLESVKTVDDVKRLRSILNQELGLSATPIQKRVTAIIADKLADLEENSIVRFAEREMKTSTAKNKIMALLDQREAANAQYSVFKDKISRLGEVLGRKRVHGAQDFLDFLESLTPEKIADKLSGKNNSQFLEWFSKEMPGGMKAISDYQKGLIRQAATKDGKLNLRSVFKAVDNMPKEYRSKIFTPDELKRINAIKTYVEAFPPKFNPSGTSHTTAFRAIFEHPLGAAAANARDFAIQGLINAAHGKGDVSKFFVEGLSTLERGAVKTTRAISAGSSAIFSKDAGSPVKGYLAISPQERREKHEKNHEKISDLTASPQKLIDHLSENTEALSQFAPQTAGSIQNTATKAIQFLQQKLPGQNVPQKPLSPKYKPSDAELAKWHKYFSAVEDPTSALYHVAAGTLVPETLETLSFVYPKLLREMQLAVTDKMTDAIAKKRVIPYRTKLSLSLFLGSDLVNSLDAHSILATQNMLATATQAKQVQEAGQMASVNKKSLGKIEKSNRLLTPMQRSAQREEA